MYVLQVATAFFEENKDMVNVIFKSIRLSARNSTRIIAISADDNNNGWTDVLQNALCNAVALDVTRDIVGAEQMFIGGRYFDVESR